MSAKSEELEDLRDGEPASGETAAGPGDDAKRVGGPSAEADALAETVSLRGPDPALAETVSLNTAEGREHMRMRPSADGDAVPFAAAEAVPVPQDVAEETARAVAEAEAFDGDGDGDGVRGRFGGEDDGFGGGDGKGADAVPGAGGFGGDAHQSGGPADDAAGNEAAQATFPSRRPRHTFLYGRGIRVLPWKHKARLNPAQRRRRKIVVRSLWGCVLIFVGTVSWSIAGALTSPGTDTVQARLAEWGRDHGMGGVVAKLEQWQYDLNPPAKGGAVDAKQFTDLGPTAGAPSAVKPSKSGAPGKPGAPSSPPADLIPMQARLPAPPGLTLEPGEGVFQVAVQTPTGQPVVQVARIRPDDVYTGTAADVVVIDQKHSKYVLHPGHEGGLNQIIKGVPNQIDSDARPNLIALFNGGFKISESGGGYYDHGVTAASLVNGAASEVIFKDGHMAVGMWGRDYSFQKNADIVSVRQNLKLMVDNGQVVSYIDDSSVWGRADHGSAAVWRSGVGVKADGDIVWVGGNDLTAPSLARLLKDAGAVRAMQLDINLRWADFQYFPGRDGNPDNSKLYEDFLQGPNKFFVNSTKDFMAVYLR